MALPVAWPTVKVFGTFLRTDGTPSQGSVVFDVAQEVTLQDDTGVVIAVLPKRFEVWLDDTGYFEIDLPATDSPVITPVGWTYQVAEKLSGLSRVPYAIEVPAAVTELNLVVWDAAQPQPVVPPVVTYLTTADIGVNVGSQIAINNLTVIANTAASEASTAVDTANSAAAAAAAATVTANGIAGTANTALANANAAVATANTANTNASTALTTANGIAGTANTALAQSTAAVATANGIAGTANTALANANTAVTTANTANTNASAAVTTANGIAGTANTALTNANTAVTTANSAVTTANAAVATANGKLDLHGKADTAGAADTAVKLSTLRTFAISGAVAGTTTSDLTAGVTIATTIADASLTVAKTSGLQAALDARSPVGLYKNKLINGNLDVWKRGTSLTAAAGAVRYLADRWATQSTGTTVAPSQQTFTPGQTAVPNGPMYFHRAVVASVVGASNYAQFNQKIEGIEQFSGQTVTLSFWAKADAAKSIGFEVQKFYGTAGTAADNAAVVSSFALTTAWTKFVFSFTVPTNTGKTIDHTSDSLGVTFWLDCGSSFTARGTIGQQSGTFDFAQLQLEPGSVATSFEPVHIGQLTTLCERYYQRLNGFGMPGFSLSSVGLILSGKFSTAMRANPTATLLKTSFTGSFDINVGGTWVTSSSTSLSAVVPTLNSINFQLAGFTGLTANVFCFINTGADVLAVDAEL